MGSCAAGWLRRLWGRPSDAGPWAAHTGVSERHVPRGSPEVTNIKGWVQDAHFPDKITPLTQ